MKCTSRSLLRSPTAQRLLIICVVLLVGGDFSTPTLRTLLEILI
jgi:hypothetical protein